MTTEETTIASLASLPITARQKRDLAEKIESYVELKESISTLEKEARQYQTAVREIVENLGVQKFLCPLRTGDAVSVAYTPTRRETIDAAELIRLGVDPKVVKKATKVVEFFALRMTVIK
jgi:hypothetical protein